MYIVLILIKDGTSQVLDIMMIRFLALVIYSGTSFCQYLVLDAVPMVHHC